MSVIRGGKFGHGFASAGFAKLATMGLEGNTALFDYKNRDFEHVLGRAVVAGVVGGTASELGGGKFANGASTAAFAQLVNGEQQGRRKATAAKESGSGKWITTDVDKKGFKNALKILIKRTKTLGDEGRMWGSDGKDFEGTEQDVVQEWTPLTADESKALQEQGLNSVNRTYGEVRIIRQTYLKGPDPWQRSGKSWHWQPAVSRQVFEFQGN